MIKFFRDLLEIFKPPPPNEEIKEICPPCHGDCDQGRNCNYGGALLKESFNQGEVK
jgi:hypothetical protein